MLPSYLRTVYVSRHVKIKSAWLGAFYFGGVGIVALWSLVQCFYYHGYVKRVPTYLETTSWRYSASDGNWWFRDNSTTQPVYCNRAHWWANDSAYGFWGSDSVECRDPESERTTLFYHDHNLLKVATSIAYGSELNSSELYFYKHVEKVGVVFQSNYYNAVGTEEVQGCRAFDAEGVEIANRWPSVAQLAGEPDEEVQKGYLMLTIEDMLQAAGSTWDKGGHERGRGMDAALPFRLQGVEMVAEINVQNYHRPFVMTSHVECSIHFKIFRNQFTDVQKFYRGEELIAVQHGLRLRVIGSATLGYPCFTTGLQTFALGLCMASCLDTLMLIVASMLHPRRQEINQAMYHELELNRAADVAGRKAD